MLAAIVRSSNDAIISKDLNGIVSSWNRAAELLFGYPAAEMIGRSIKTLIPEDRLHEEDMILGAISRGEQIENYETVRRRKDGSLVEISVSVSPVRDGAGTIVGAAKIARDISRQKATEAALRHAVQARDEFLSVASHELKTPLTSLRMQVQMRKRSLLKNDLGAFSPERLAKMIDADERQIFRLIRLIDDMLDVARISAGKLNYAFEPMDLESVVREVAERFQIELQQSGSGLTIDAEGPSRGTWDRFRIEQVVTNLLSNAIKYGAGKPLRIRISRGGGYVSLAFEDQGIGVAEHDQARIFDQFERAVSRNEVAGLGLGLYIVREIVQAHGGMVSLRSRLGSGSTFTVSLPEGDAS